MPYKTAFHKFSQKEHGAVRAPFAVFLGIDSRAAAVYNLSAGLDAGQMPERIADKSGGGAVK